MFIFSGVKFLIDKCVGVCLNKLKQDCAACVCEKVLLRSHQQESRFGAGKRNSKTKVVCAE